MTKTFVSTRDLPKIQSQITPEKQGEYFIVMNRSQPKSLCVPYHPEVEKAIENALEHIELQKAIKEGLTDFKQGNTFSSNEIRAEINNAA